MQMKQDLINSIFEELKTDIGLDLRSWIPLKLSFNEQISSRLQIPLFKKKYVSVFWTPNGRRLIYDLHNSLLLQSHGLRWQLSFDFQDPQLLYKVLRDFYISANGLIEESQGRMRLHACAILQNDGAQVYWGLPGAGKSSLAAHYWLNNLGEPITDELLFLDGSGVQATGLAVSLKSNSPFFNHSKLLHKTFIPDRVLIPMANTKSYRILTFHLLTDRPMIEKFGIQDKLKFVFNVLLGIGVHQMTEYHFTLSQLPLWAKVFQTRIRGLRRILRFSLALQPREKY